MPIEASVMPGSGILLTGKLGDVIKESAQIALSFIKANAYNLQLTKSPTDDLLEKKAIHLHMPEGAIGKEGPSAGTAIFSALISLFSGARIPSTTALTGEMTLAVSLTFFSTISIHLGQRSLTPILTRRT